MADSNDVKQDEAGSDAEVSPPTRQLRRAREGRWVSGVSAGLARYFGLHPAVYRIGFVALAFVGGVGILLYLIAALVVPVEGSDESLAEGFLRRHRDRPVLLVVAALVAFAAVFVLSSPGPGDGPDHGPWSWPLAGPFAFLLTLALAIGVIAAVSNHDRAVAAAGAGTGAVTGAGPASQAAQPSQPLPPSIFLPGLGVVLTAAGVVFLLEALDVVDLPAGAVLAGGVILFGLLVVAGALLRRTRGLVLLALAVAVATCGVALATVEWEGGVGERTWRPVAAADLEDEYRLAVGRLELDLREVELPPGETRLAATVGMGELVVYVPDDVAVSANAEAGAGDVTVLGLRDDGFDARERMTEAGFEDAERRLVVAAEVDLGEVRIDRGETADLP